MAKGDFVRITLSPLVSPGFKLSLHTRYCVWFPPVAEVEEVQRAAPILYGNDCEYK